MGGGHSLSGGPGSRGWELATASSQSGASSRLLRERRCRHKLRTGVGSALTHCYPVVVYAYSYLYADQVAEAIDEWEELLLDCQRVFGLEHPLTKRVEKNLEVAKRKMNPPGASSE